jgi:hypothetical protein
MLPVVRPPGVSTREMMTPSARRSVVPPASVRVTSVAEYVPLTVAGYVEPPMIPVVTVELSLQAASSATQLKATSERNWAGMRMWEPLKKCVEAAVPHRTA